MEMIYVGENVENQLTNGKTYKMEVNQEGHRVFTKNNDSGKGHWFTLGFMLQNFIHPSHYKPELKQEPQALFQVGDVVYHWQYGSGKISRIDKDSEYSIIVNFETLGECRFTKDGRLRKEQEPSLSFTPYNFKTGGLSQERPKPEPKVGDWGWFWDDSNDYGCFGKIDRITRNSFVCGGLAFFKHFSHEAPPHIAKHLKKSPNENQ